MKNSLLFLGIFLLLVLYFHSCQQGSEMNIDSNLQDILLKYKAVGLAVAVVKDNEMITGWLEVIPIWRKKKSFLWIIFFRSPQSQNLFLSRPSCN